MSHLFSKLKNTVIQGTLILTITAFATRLIGFYNRIFLADLIGARELGVYQLIFPLYMLVFAVSTQGIQLALTKLISHYHAKNDIRTMHSFFRAALLISFTLSVMIAIIMYAFSPYICVHILRSTDCIPCVRILSLCVPVISIKGCIHGYLLGLEDSVLTGSSNLIEQTAKVFGLMFLATYVVTSGFDATFAVWGIVIGEFASCIFSIITFTFMHAKERKALSSSDKGYPNSLLKRTVYRLLLKDGIPFTSGRLGMTGLQSMEAILIPSMLMLFYHDGDTSLELYGIFTGMAFPFIMFPASLTNSLSTVLMPAVSSAKATLDYNYIRRLAEKSLYFCLIIGIFSTFVFYMFGMEIGVLVFKNEQTGAYLFMLAFLCPFIYIATTMSSILNGLGMTTTNLFYFVIATGIRIVFIVFAVPKVGMQGYLWGLLVSYLFLTGITCYTIHKKIGLVFDAEKNILFPCFAAIILGALTHHIYHHYLTGINLATLLLLACAITAYGLIYLVILYLPEWIGNKKAKYS